MAEPGPRTPYQAALARYGLDCALAGCWEPAAWLIRPAADTGVLLRSRLDSRDYWLACEAHYAQVRGCVPCAVDRLRLEEGAR